jgi:hypothetical protein
MMLPVMYAEFLPALLSMTVSLVWFCFAVTTLLHKAPATSIWGMMALVVVAAGSVFFVTPAAAWVILGAQLLVSIAVVRWYGNYRKDPRPAQNTQLTSLHEHLLGE